MDFQSRQRLQEGFEHPFRVFRRGADRSQPLDLLSLLGDHGLADLDVLAGFGEHAFPVLHRGVPGVPGERVFDAAGAAWKRPRGFSTDLGQRLNRTSTSSREDLQ